MANLLDGKTVSRRIREELKVRVDLLRSSGIIPRLDVLVAGHDPASLSYVKMKHRWAEEVGIIGESYQIENSTPMSWVLDRIAELNDDEKVHGVLIQHPLPSHLDELAALDALGPHKDVDGITPQSLGRLVCGSPGFRCATPLGMIRLLDEYKLDCCGKNAVVIGRSLILGKPAALMLLERNATVTICHSKTENLNEICKQADIVVAAVGKPEMVKGDWLKKGAIVIDAGYNKVEGREKDVGDVEFSSAERVAGWITPVPGGVGPMTVAMLLSNVVASAEGRLTFN